MGKITFIKLFLLILTKIVTGNQTNIQNQKFNCTFEYGDKTCMLSNISIPTNSSEFLDVSLKSEEITGLIINDSYIPTLNLTNLCVAFPNIHRIAVMQSTLNEITPDSLNECRQLKKLILNCNDIKTLDVNIFKNNENMEKLFLRNAKLREFPYEITMNLRNLNTLILPNNELVDLDIESIFKNSPKLKYINIQDNDFACDRLEQILTVIYGNGIGLQSDSIVQRVRDYKPRDVLGIKCLSPEQYEKYVLNPHHSVKRRDLEEKIANYVADKEKVKEDEEKNKEKINYFGKAVKNFIKGVGKEVKLFFTPNTGISKNKFNGKKEKYVKLN